MIYRSKILRLVCFVVVLIVLPASAAAENGDYAFVGATVYPSPSATPLHDAVVLTSGGAIVAVGKRGEVKIPKSAKVIDCLGKTIVAGFWNSHIHLIEEVWNDAANAPAAKLEQHMQDMLTRWGFTTVWDLGSTPQNSIALRRRVESGEIPGPRIFLAGSIFPEHGHPVYLPAELQLPEASTPAQAVQMARGYLDLGLDGIKLFTGVFMGDKPVINMDTSIVKAAVGIAHADGKPVFTHPQNRAGVDNALDGGVDILAHTVPTEPNYTAEELSRFKVHHTGLIPTLTLWTTVVSDPVVTKQLVQSGVDELKTFHDNGGAILFGTDIGFISHFDTSLEFELMGRALPWTEVLASLTTNPSTYFAAKKGRVEKGFAADLVILDADPAADVRNLAKVAYTLRAGKIIYHK